VRAAVNAASDVLPIPQQFVFRNSSARAVSVVGDFNGWNAASTPMTRDPNGDLWSVTIPIAPGRHTYGFMVNDSLFTLDPDSRVARARDPDLGVEGSVVIVGRP
jgi:1,4-alpha-glucan branching enzyme